MNNEVEARLFAPEVLLPAQFSWGARCDGDTSGERALMLAILEEALLCIERGHRRRHPRTRRLAAEAETWIRSDCREWLFSFATICDVLGIDVDAVRLRVLPSVEPPANSGGTARTEASALFGRNGVVGRSLSQRGSTPGFVTVDSARTPFRGSIRNRGARSGLGMGARLGAA